MRERPTALGFASLLTLLAALHVARSADAASVARQCRRACRGEIAACVDGGGHHRACRKSVLGRCKQDGLTVCQGADGLNNGRRPKGSTTTTTTTTTTTQPGATTTTTRSAVTTTTLAGAARRPRASTTPRITTSIRAAAMRPPGPGSISRT